MVLARATAAAVSLTAVIGLLGFLGPAGAGAALLLLPLPALVLGQLGGVVAALAVAAGTAVIGAAVIDSEAACLYLAFAGLPAVSAIWALRRGWRIETVIGVAAAVVLVGLGASFWGFRGELTGLQTSLAQAWQESFARALDLYRHLGMSDEQLADLELQRTYMQRVSLAFFPAILILCIEAMWFLNLRLARRWSPWPQLENLKGWQAPPWLIWALIATGFGLFVPHAGVSLAARNAFAVLLGCYFCQGLAIVSFYLQRLGLPSGLRLASYMLIALQHFVAAVVLLLGVFDLWGDFRRLSVSAAGAQGHADSE